jgi:predicted ribonuclease YlaK
LGIRPEALFRKVSELSGRVEPSAADKQKVWCFCDTNLFLHYKSVTNPDWHRQLGRGDIVLVVPAGVIRELDDLKFQRSGQVRTQARRMLTEIKKVAFQAQASGPANVGNGVELLLLGREPRAFPEGLDSAVADDRLIAMAYEFRWQRPGLTVALLSGDTTVQLKAREYSLDFIELPTCMEIPSEAAN